MNENCVVNSLSSSQKTDFLRHYDLIDNDLKEDIEKTVKYRSRVIHDPQKRYRITNLDRLSERISTAQDTIEMLAERIRDTSNETPA